MKKVVTFFVLAVMSLVAVYAANSGESTPATQADEATLTVNVTDASGNPLEGAYVSSFNPYFEVATDAAGVAKVTGLNAEAVSGKIIDIAVIKEGYAEYSGKADFTEDLNPVVNVTLSEQMLTVTISVVDAEYEPIEGAWVTFMGADHTSDENGKVVVEGLSALQYLGSSEPFSVYKDGYEYYEGEVVFEDYQPAAVAMLQAAEATLTIKVFAGKDAEDENAVPLEGAVVYFMNGEYTSDENGNVNITQISAPAVFGKKVPFFAYKDGYEGFEGEADFSETTDVFTMAYLAPAEGSWTVKVFAGEDDEALPAKDARVTFMDNVYTTNELGEVKVTGINAPDVVGRQIPFTVYLDGYDPYDGVADFKETMDAYTDVHLVETQAILKVKVITGEENDPVAGAMVTVLDKVSYTDTNGEANVLGIKFVDVAGKNIPYTVMKDGYEPFEGMADFTESMEANPIAQIIASKASITVKVITGEENDPVEGAYVTFTGIEGGFIADENGNATVSDLYAPDFIGKEVPFCAYKDGYEPFNGIVTFDMLEAQGIAILIPAEASISIKVYTGEDNDPVEGATVTVNEKEYTTDAKGEVKITGLYGPDVFGTQIPVTVSKSGYVTYNAVADFSETLDAQVPVLLEKDDSSIREIKAATANSQTYDLRGRSVSIPANGHIYIVNGRKVRF